MALTDPAAGAMVYKRKPEVQSPEALARAHMPLVRKIAWHVHGRVSTAIEVEDLIQIGMIALVEAANGYEDRGHAFATYATMRIRGAMIDHLRRQATLCRSAMVLQLYFVEEMNLEEIGLTLGIGAARVCQIKKAALEKVRGLLSEWE